jgi:hypothetical protein
MSGMMIMMTGNVQRVIPSGGGGGGDYATGGIVVDISGYKVHIFNSSNTFATTSSWPSGRTIEYLVVGGGGGGDAGGGGAGGLLSSNGVTAAASTNYAVTVGGGGSFGANGANSSVIGGAISVTSFGGGYGGSFTPTDGGAGGSGGGGGHDGNQTTASGGLGTPGQGNNGFAGFGKQTTAHAGDGGGAANTGAGLICTMLQTTSSGSVTITGNQYNYGDTTITVSSGLWFQSNQAIYMINTSGFSYWGIVNSYSGTSLSVRLYNQYPNPVTWSASVPFTISLAHAGGGTGYWDSAAGYPDQQFLGGGGGKYGPNERSGAPNSGGGGLGGSGGLLYNGGSGVVLIKYAYP